MKIKNVRIGLRLCIVFGRGILASVATSLVGRLAGLSAASALAAIR